MSRFGFVLWSFSGLVAGSSVGIWMGLALFAL
jgi:hypothetical protein